MKKLVTAALVGKLMVPVIAFAQINAGDTVGTSEDAIRTALEAQGYEVKEFELEDDEIEVEAVLDGTEYEIEVSVETGKVVEVELDDDADSESDDS